MTDVLNRAGITAQCVVGATEANERRMAPIRLASGEVSALVTCDLYNEGVDLPQVDTILLLRPTQSPVLFQQQIGRGLRLAPGKESCLILDFVGIHRREFRFDRLLSSITGLARRPLLDAVENGFGSLSPGCHIHLHRQTRDQVLNGLQLLVQQNWRRLCLELQAYVALKGRNNIRLMTFLSEQNIELEDILRGSGNSGWTSLKRAAGLLASDAGSEEKYFSSHMYALLHFDDRARIHLLHQIGASGADFKAENTGQIQLLQMLAYQIDGHQKFVGTGPAFLARLCAQDEIRNEISEIAEVLQTRISVQEKRIPGLEDLPMSLHGRYSIREILTAAGWLTPERRTPFQAGVLAIQDRKVELLFVTLDKSEGYSERISYRDYAISTERFHWQSQNSASAESAAGRRYLDSPKNGWTFQLFVRLNKRDPYRACGPVTLESAEGSKPIYWRLQVPLPLAIFHEFSILRGE